MRGLPWTGKSYTAKQLAGNSGLIYSTDDYWHQIVEPENPEKYSFDPIRLADAHNWNLIRAKKSMDEGFPLIIIDNTNTTSREPKKYVEYAIEKGYEVKIQEPHSERWKEISLLLKNKNNELLKIWASKLAEGSKENHNVPAATIEKMMARWENNMTIETILASK